MTDALLVIGNYTYSSWSMRAWLAVQRTGMEPVIERIPLDTPEFHARIRDYSPSARVPVLRHEELTVWDSLAICEYLAERYPEAGLWPPHARLRAHARSVCAEMHAGFEHLRNALPFNCRARDRRVATDTHLQADIDRIAAIWAGCNEMALSAGANGPWLYGAFTAADCMYIPVALRFLTYGIDPGRDGRRYLAAVEDDPGVRLWCARAADETEVIEAEEIGRNGDDR